MCAFADNKKQAALSDMELILQDIMVDDVPAQSPALSTQSVLGGRDTNLEKVLLRGVTALENIDKKLNLLVSKEADKSSSSILKYQKIFRDADVKQ